MMVNHKTTKNSALLPIQQLFIQNNIYHNKKIAYFSTLTVQACVMVRLLSVNVRLHH
jgi:hypothetical protein